MSLKQIYCSLLLLTISYTTANSQSHYHDAETLKSYLDAGGKFTEANIDAVEKILARYSDEDFSINEVQNVYNSNPFIKSFFPPVETKSSALLSGGGGLEGMPSLIGGLNVVTFADGLAKFLVKRTKDIKRLPKATT